jgi:hypothetical protein
MQIQRLGSIKGIDTLQKATGIKNRDQAIETMARHPVWKNEVVVKPILSQ